MTKDNWQKVKLLKMMDMLRAESSPEHPLTTERICGSLANQGINCDRKTLTKDIQTLRNYGYEVGARQIGHEKGYYVLEKKEDFTLAEQKIIIDALQAANFITREKTDELITKVAELNIEQKEHILSTSVVCFNKKKHSNEEIYANVGILEDALSQRKKASFVYFNRDENGEKIYLKERERYVVEPMALIFNDDNYYLMCLSSKYDGVTNYRVDRMDEIEIEDEPVSEKAIIPDDDIAAYTEQVFKMYNGPATDITIEFDDKLIGVIQDKFGEDTKIVRTSKDRCVASIKVQVSPVFWGWIFQFVGEMSIVSPEVIKNEYKKRIFDAVNM